MPTIPSTARLSATAVEILNAIRNSSTQNYRNLVPVADSSRESIRSIGTVIMGYTALQNEFLTALINRIGRVEVTSKNYTNPWSMFKRGKLDFGESIEEVFVNLAKPFVYDPVQSQSTVFKREIPDVRSAFHYLNYQIYYKNTIENDRLRQAFLSWEGITDLISYIVEQMYSSAAYDEFMVMKYMLAKHILNGQLYAEQVDAVTSANMKSIVGEIKSISNKFTFKSNKYNLAGVANNVDKENQYIILNSDFDATMDVEVLASAFNMSKADFMGHRVLVDGLGELDDDRLALLFADDSSYSALTSDEKAALNAIPAVIVDRDFFMIYDNLDEFTELFNGEALSWQYWYHVWKTFSVSPFANATVFVPAAPSVSAVSVSPASATVSAGQVATFTAEVTTANFAPKSVDWSISGVLGLPAGLVVNGNASSGASTVNVDGATITNDQLKGYKVKFGSATTEYTITGNTATALTITPSLAANVSDNATITSVGTATGSDLPATISPSGVLTVMDTCPAGTVITVTAKSTFNTSITDTATVTVS